MMILRLLLTCVCLMLTMTMPALADSVLARLLPGKDAAELVEGADGFGPIGTDPPVAAVMKGGETIGWAFITSDFVGTTGYSGRPIHTLVAVDKNAKIIGVKLVEHDEPIVLIGIPEAKVKAFAAGYTGMDLVAEAQSGGTGHDVDIISGATVTVMVIDDSIVRSGIAVSRKLGLGGLSSGSAATGPQYEINPDATPDADWAELTGDGSVRNLHLKVAEVNESFARNSDPRAAKHPLTEAGDTDFIDLYAGLVSVPAIGQAVLYEGDNKSLEGWLAEGDNVLMLAGNGLYSFKGSGYVRGGIFDRVVLIQDDISVRFHDRDHRRISGSAADGAPRFTETDLFRIPADSGFDPTRPFRIQLLVQRAVGPTDKVFETFDLAYQLPTQYMTEITSPAPAPTATAPVPGLDGAAITINADEAAAQSALWMRIWKDSKLKIAIVGAMLVVLTAVFFFQFFATRNERRFYIFRMAYLTVTLVVLGWWLKAQLSVVNVLAVINSFITGFSWQAFLLDPLTFILWFAVAAALLFWGRGAYCGWLCPFGALQELTNQIARKLRIPQWELPWGLHERLWPVKYMIFLGLFGVSLVSLGHAERLAEVEPFKTAIILKFMRAWPFVAYVGALLIAGLFVERFFCRYMCPLGAALAIPARIRMFDWLKRYHECGNPCQTCANECPVQAIHPTGEIDPNECINCLHCQMLYQSESRCPVVIKRLKRRQKLAASGVRMPELGRPPEGHPNAAPAIPRLK